MSLRLTLSLTALVLTSAMVGAATGVAFAHIQAGLAGSVVTDMLRTVWSLGMGIITFGSMVYGIYVEYE